MKKIFLITFLGSLLLFPLVSLAGTYKVDSKDVYYEGLVPCGIDKPLCDAPFEDGKCPGTIIRTKVGEEEHEGMPCQFCHFFVMFRGILDFVLKLVIVIGVLMLTIGGFMFLFAGGSPKILESAKRILTSTVIGLVIIFAAWMIINTIFMAIGVADWTGLKEGWFSIECSIKPVVEKEKENYQKKVTNLEEEIEELEENRAEAISEGNTKKAEELAKQITEKEEALKSYETELTHEKEKEKEVEVVVTKEEKEKHCRWEECGRGPINPCDEEECLALGDSVGPCQFIATWRFFSWTEWYGECKPK